MADLRRLRHCIPYLPDAATLHATQAELQGVYHKYITEVSSPGWATSLETASFLLALCRNAKIRSALDLGTGFSSYVLRRWGADSGASVASVDDDPIWLGRTRQFLELHGLDSDHLVAWNDRPVDSYDLVFHDLASGSLREEAMPYAVERADRFTVFDDAQHVGHRMAMRAACVEAGSELYSLSSLTKDQSGRFAMMGFYRRY